MMYGWGPHMGAYGLGFGLGWILTIVFWVLVIWAIVALARWLIRGNSGMRGRGWMERKDSAMEILRERYAKGEISKEEFEERKKNLM